MAKPVVEVRAVPTDVKPGVVHRRRGHLTGAIRPDLVRSLLSSKD